MINMEALIQVMNERGASDIHIVAGAAPQLRIDGKLQSLEMNPLTPELCQELVYSVLTEDQKRRFEETGELDLSFGIKDLGRIRMNVFRQKGTVGAALRSIPNEPKTFAELNLPDIVQKITELPRGLVLVTGPTGSGKSTTLAAIIDFINQYRQERIVTVEDPIEFLHRHKSCVVTQREIGSDTASFAQALKHVLRQDPDVILIGEMRDLETISATLTIAETGHLAFATLHTQDAIQSINRIIDVFPPHQQQQVRVQLSMVLQAIICQQLLPKASGRGRVLACEVLWMTSGIRNLIREQKIHQVYTLIQSGRKYGMMTMNMSLADHYRRGNITLDEAMSRSGDPEDLRRLIEGGRKDASVRL